MIIRRIRRFSSGAFSFPWGARLAILSVASICAIQVWAASPERWRAIGHEPSWSLTRADGQMTLETDFGAKRTSFPTPTVTRVDDRTVLYTGTVDGASLRLTVKSEICADTMTGMPRPEQVSLTFGDRKFEGCGGEPASLLKGSDWVVTELAGRAALPEPLMTVTFSDDGRVSGSASCNRFGADWQLSGEGLTIGKGMSSMMACEERVMQQEQSFLAAMQSVARFSRPSDRVLVLHTNDDRTIVLKKP
jgi:heat shock protein HslJ